MSDKIQRYERNTFYDHDLYCPMCGQEILKTRTENPKINPCEHTLFIAHDEGYEFIAARVIAQLSAKGFTIKHNQTGFEIESESENAIPSPDKFTDELEFPDALKVASYVGPPSGLGSYVGFAPIERE